MSGANHLGRGHAKRHVLKETIGGAKNLSLNQRRKKIEYR